MTAPVIDDAPLELVTSKDDGSEAARVRLFSIDGVDYTIPAKPRVNIALKYLWHAKQFGEDRAAAEMLEALLGSDGFEALVNYDDLEPAQLQQIMQLAAKHTLGALEATKGNSGRGPSK